MGIKSPADPERILTRRQWSGLLLELLLWLGVAGAFLSAYVTDYAAPSGSALPHFAVVGTFWVSLATVRLALYRAISSAKVAALVGTALMVSGYSCLIAYYLAVLIGLDSWGRVISWSLIASYALQIPHLVSALGVSLRQLAAGTTVLLVSMALVVRWIHRADWVAAVPRRLSPAMIPIIIFAGIGFSSVRLQAFVAYPPVATGEPISLTLFPEQEVRRLQSTTSRATTLMDRQEAVARAAYQPNPSAKRRNVILVVADALRPDHMSVYGYHRQTTPYLDSLLRAGRVQKVERMLAACGESSCGLLALAQGRYVHEIPSRGFTLQEALKRHGYSIWMILGGDHTNFYGLKELYGEVDHYFDGAQAKGYYLNDDRLVLDHVASLPPWDGAPVMMQIHLMSSHGLGTRREEEEVFRPWTNYYSIPDGRELVRAGRPNDRITNYYDNGVRSFDAALRDIASLLQRKGYLDDAIVVITGDHGELLGEHGEFSHGRTLYEAVLRVPFLLVSFGDVSERSLASRRVASQVDAAPTILHELGMPLPSTWSGEPLQTQAQRDFIYFQQGGLVGLVDLRSRRSLWKYVLDIKTGKERASDISSLANEEIDEINMVTLGNRLNWRREVMGAVASVIVK